MVSEFALDMWFVTLETRLSSFLVFTRRFLSKAALRGYSPFSTLISVGFVVDGDGRKMSKSLGNVISPSTIISGGKVPQQVLL